MNDENELICPVCKGVVEADDFFCNNCGASLKETQTIPEQPIITQPEIQARSIISQPMEPQSVAPTMVVTTYQTGRPVKSRSVLAVVSLIFTGIAALLFLIPCPCVSIFGGLPISAVGLILGIIAVAKKPRRKIDWIAFSFGLAAPAIWGLVHILMYGFYIY